jgi:hypothetical protein
MQLFVALVVRALRASRRSVPDRVLENLALRHTKCEAHLDRPTARVAAARHRTEVYKNGIIGYSWKQEASTCLGSGSIGLGPCPD